MAKSGFSAMIAGLLLLPSACLAATLHGEKEPSLVRRESGKAKGVSPHDELLQGEEKPADAYHPTCEGCETHDFIMGLEKSNSCRYANETLVDDVAMCRYAAEHANAHYDPDWSFKIYENRWQVLHPVGCFHVRCVPFGKTNETDCYFMNMVEYNAGISDPTHADFTGTPVCHRNKWMDGTESTQGGCPSDEYRVIQNEQLCSELCHVDDYHCSDDHFLIGNANWSQHWDYPQGCFHLLYGNATFNETRVYFNTISNASRLTVHGTPMCEVASPLNWITNPASVNSGGSHVNHTWHMLHGNWSKLAGQRNSIAMR